MARKRRITFRLAALILAGLLANWLVAVVILSYGPASAQPGMALTDPLNPVFHDALPPGLPRPDVAFIEPGIGQTYWQFYAGDGLTTSPFIAHMSHAGAPMRSWSILQLARKGPPIPIGAYREGVLVDLPRWVPGPLRPGIGSLRLPLRPLPLGLLINTLFYAALFAFVMEAFAAFRTRRRARRSLCTRCKYPVRGLITCPECGTAVPTGSPNTAKTAIS